MFIHLESTGSNDVVKAAVIADQTSLFDNLITPNGGGLRLKSNGSIRRDASSILNNAESFANSAAERIPAVTPRVDVADKFVKTPLGNGGFRFTYGDPTTHGLEAFVTKDGVLSFDIRANQKLAAEQGSGTDMASSLMNRLANDGIEVNRFDAQWMKGSKQVSVNYWYYDRNYRSMGELNAARGTWTGQFFAKYGFDIIEPPAILNVPIKTYLPVFVKVKP